MQYSRALIIGEPWIDKILARDKLLEMRSRHTKMQGQIGLIRKGSGLIVGEAWLYPSVELIEPESFKVLHGIDYAAFPELLKYNIAWPLGQVKSYDAPIPYDHPQGAVIWVKV
ncbi:MAG: hypothetical protein KAV87_55490 [Desulfobacteraceae bacterium]|nr:hypothetical protein [Desulfobacteraceae bacterium]